MAENKMASKLVSGLKHWFPLLIATVAFLLYANTIANNFAVDDGAVITNNPYVQQGLKGIPGIFTQDVWHFEGNDLGYYRPLPLSTFAIENQFFSNNPHISHLVNAILYALTCLILYFFLLHLFKSYSPQFSMIVVLLFAAHPIHTEVVANIKSRDELLAFLNLLMALWLLLLSINRHWIWLLLSSFFYYLALLSKETAITGVIIAPVILYFSTGIPFKQVLKLTASFILVLLLFEIQKHAALGTSAGGEVLDVVSFPYTSGSVKIPTAFVHFWYYIRLICLPYPLSYNYAYNQIPAGYWTDWQCIAGITLSLILSAVCFWRIRQKNTLQLGSIIFMLMLIPALAFVYLKGGVFAERFLYAPSLGFCIVLTWLIVTIMHIPINAANNNPSYNIARYTPFAIIFCCYSFITVTRNRDWKDDLSIAQHDVNITPNSCQVHLHYGKKLIDSGANENDIYQRRNYFTKGMQQLHDALTINPHYARAYYKIAYAYQVVEPNADSAIYYYNKAIDEAPGYALAYNNLASVYANTGRLQLAEHCLQKALELNPGLSEASQNLQRLQQIKSTAPDAIDTTTFEYCSATGVKLARGRNFNAALKYLTQAVKIKPQSVEALVNLAACYGMMQDFSKSETTLLKAQQLEPGNKSVLQNLFTLYHITGNKMREEEYRSKLAKIN